MNTVELTQFKKEIDQFHNFLLSYDTPLLPMRMFLTFNKAYLGIFGNIILFLKNEYTEVHLSNIKEIYSQDLGDTYEYNIVCKMVTSNQRGETEVIYKLVCS